MACPPQPWSVVRACSWLSRQEWPGSSEKSKRPERPEGSGPTRGRGPSPAEARPTVGPWADSQPRARAAAAAAAAAASEACAAACPAAAAARAQSAAASAIAAAIGAEPAQQARTAPRSSDVRAAPPFSGPAGRGAPMGQCDRAACGATACAAAAALAAPCVTAAATPAWRASGLRSREAPADAASAPVPGGLAASGARRERATPTAAAARGGREQARMADGAPVGPPMGHAKPPRPGGGHIAPARPREAATRRCRRRRAVRLE